MANSIANFSGLGSGIDFSAVTDAIIAQRSRPIALLQGRRASLNTQADAFKQLNAKLITLTEAARTLTDRTLGTDRSATSSNASVATATATNGAVAGSFSLNVTRLASAYAEVSRTYTAQSAPVLVSGAPATFELRTGGASSGTTIQLDSSNNTLAGLRDAINASDAGVNASIVDVTGAGTEFRLVLTSKQTGAANRVQLVETSATGAGADLALGGVADLGSPPDYSALDASFKLNGLTLTRPTNTVSNAVAGVSFELQGVGAASVNVAADSTSFADKLSAFVEAYNGAQDFINTQYSAASAGKVDTLAGDPTLRDVQRQMRDALGAISNANGGALKNLTQLGIGRDNAGKLTLNRATLDARLADSFTDVSALFSGAGTGQTGLANSMLAVFSKLSDNISGTVQTTVGGIKTSVASLDKLIVAQQERLELLRESLTRQFAIVDAAIGQLNGQGTALTNVIKSLQSSNN